QRREVPLPDELADDAAVEAPDVDRFWVEAALERLPERERHVIELAYFHDLSQRAIAAELRVPLGSVKSWTRRGLHRLATLLGEGRAGRTSTPGRGCPPCSTTVTSRSCSRTSPPATIASGSCSCSAASTAPYAARVARAARSAAVCARAAGSASRPASL